jgi:hypothetical protein
MLNRVIRGVAPFVVPFLTQAVLVLGVGTLWPSAWAWMNALATKTSILLSMAVILGPSLLVGLTLLIRAFGRRAMLIAIIYVPLMTVALSSWTAHLALCV